MTLATRVSAFFLGWLGLSLIGFAVAVYLMVRADLYDRADQRLNGTLDTLVAAAEVDRVGVEWEPNERTLPRGTVPGSVVWLVVVPDGPVVDRSNPTAGDWLLSGPIDTCFDPTGAPWLVARRRLEVGTPEFRPPPIRTLGTDPQAVVKYAALEIVGAIPLNPIRQDLNRLAGVLGALTIGLWLTAAFTGRWLCRRTLAPVAQMAASARTISPSAAGQRLAVRPTGDELEDLGRAFNGALNRLEEALERQRRFTGDASHQLRTPLAAMLGQVEVALRRDREAPEYRATLQTVADDVRHLNRLTEALLFLARADAEAALPGLQDLDLSGWATGFVKEWRSQHPEAPIETAFDSQPGRVRAHPELLAQLCENLLDNAIKYGPPGAPVVVRVASRNAGAELVVEDAGPGVAEEDLPHIFEPFFRSAAARAAGVRGVGLGLAIAHRIAESMGGRLSAENLPRGSRFTIWLPTPAIPHNLSTRRNLTVDI